MAGPEKIPSPFPHVVRFRMPGHTGRILILAGLVLFVVLIVCTSCFRYVRPNEIGIKQVNIGVNRGIQEKPYGPGFAFVLPFGFEEMHRLPANVQVLELTAEKIVETPSRHWDRVARIQTSDGFYVDVDATILYRITDPYRVITTAGKQDAYLKIALLPKAEPVLKRALGELTTEDFYNSPKRVEKAEKAKQILEAALEPAGIRIEHVLIRYFKYSDEIQKNIEEKKLQDQLVFKNQAEARAATEQANLKRVSQEGEMKVKVTLQEGQAYKVKKEADRDLYVRKKEAEADLLVKLAEAKRTELTNEAMQVVGSNKMVAMRMAEVMKGLDTIIVPSGGQTGINPLDLNGMMALFGAAPEAGQTQTRTPVSQTPSQAKAPVSAEVEE